MKRIISIIATFFTGVAFLLGQDCTPDESITVQGIYPDTIQNLDTALVNVYYEQILQLKALEDTVVDPYGLIPVNTLTVDSVQGLPEGFDFTCSPSECVFPGGSNGCVVLYGTPVDGQDGTTYPITVHATAEVEITVLGFTETAPYPFEITGYELYVDGPNNVNELGMSIMIYNDVNYTKFDFNKEYEEIKFNVYDATGRLVLSEKEQHSGVIYLSLNNYSSGIYFVEFTIEGKRSIHKIIR